MLNRIIRRRHLPALAGAVLVVAVIGAGTATAASLVTSKDVKDGTLRSVDVKDGSLRVKDLTDEAVDTLQKGGATGATGERGATGPAGAQGPQGPKGDKGADGVLTVTAAANGFSASNSSVHFTSTGVTFGPYADSSSEGGSLKYTGVAGKTLADIAQLAYSARYTGSANGGAPYLRVFIDNNGDGFTGAADDHDVIFSPSTQPGACSGPGGGGGSTQCDTSGRLIKYDVTEGTVRYDDDGGNAPDVTWDQVLNAHGNDHIDSIRISAGFALPGTISSQVNSLSYELAGLSPKLVTFSN
jgi:hypothetical protein